MWTREKRNVTMRGGITAAIISALGFLALPAGCAPSPHARRWLGEEFWANRLQDWRFANGRIECVCDSPGKPVRTAFLLTRQIEPGEGGVRLAVRTGMLDGSAASGWSGFLIGIGGGRLDYRAAALVHHFSGEGGGLMAVFQADGRCSFREHTSESQPRAFAELQAELAPKDVSYRRRPGEEVELTLEIQPSAEAADRFELTLMARAASGQEISRAVLRGVEESQLLGGIALVSHPGGASEPGTAPRGAGYWFGDVRVAGGMVRHYPHRAWGPVAGTMFCLNGRVLRLTAQFMPLGPTARDKPGEYTAARLDYLSQGGIARAWVRGPAAGIEAPPQTALFRLADWDSRNDYEYRIVPLRPDGSEAPQRYWYGGRIPRDPVEKDPLVVAAFTGCCFAGRCPDRLDKPAPAEGHIGRFTPESIWIPNPAMEAALRWHKPDILLFTGDQIYQGVPTGAGDPPFPADDFLYKWLHWLASFRGLTAEVPTVLQADDHDVYQGNIWGWSGRKNTSGRNWEGGYIYSPEFINMVQRCMCAHDADPYDPAPVQQGIGVYYTAFKYGGVSFAVLEDRKFKTPASVPPEQGELLGERQEKFLSEWARDWQGAAAKIVVSQTTYSSVGTDEKGAVTASADTNGFPKPARDRAVRLFRQAGALGIGGDQHLTTVVCHGLEGYEDGFVQFVVPAVGSTFQRWWSPAQAGAGRQAGAPDYTGNFTDGFGNRFRVLAAANPAVSLSQASGPTIRDRRLTKTGYGLIRVSKKARQFVLECWPGQADPATGDKQFPGWPVRVAFPKPQYGPEK